MTRTKLSTWTRIGTGLAGLAMMGLACISLSCTFFLLGHDLLDEAADILVDATVGESRFSDDDFDDI